jgi:hypothetical protein
MLLPEYMQRNRDSFLGSLTKYNFICIRVMLLIDYTFETVYLLTSMKARDCSFMVESIVV